MQSTIRVKDRIWDIFDMTEQDIPLFEHSYFQQVPFWIPSDTPIEDRTYVSVYLRHDTRSRLYKREEYDLLTYFGDVGGLLDIVLLFGFALSSPFIGRLFHAALVKENYRI